MKRQRRATGSPWENSAADAATFEKLIMRLATRFVNAPVERLDGMINEALRLSGRGAGVDRSYLMRYDVEKRVVRNTHEWCEEGIEPMIEHLREVSFDGLEDFWESHLKGCALLVSRVSDLKEGSRLRQVLEPQGIQTLVAVPLMNGDGCLGFVGFDAVTHHKEWSQEEIDLLWVLAEVFINAEHSVARERALSEAREAAELAEKRLQRAVLAGDFAIWERDLQREEIRYVCGWNRLTGRVLDGSVAPINHFFEMVPRDDWARLHECVSDCLRRTDEQFEVDFLIQRKSGELVEVRGRWVVDQREGRAVRLVGSVEDISQLMREQREALERAEVEALANSIAARFSRAAAFEKAVRAAFADFMEHTGARRVSLWRPQSDGTLELVFTEPRQEGPAIRVKPGDAGCLEVLRQGGSVRVAAEGDGPCALRDWIKAGGNDWATALPVRSEFELDGVLLAESRRQETTLESQDQHLLQLIAHIFAGAMARNLAEEKLRMNQEFYWMILEGLSEAVLLTTLEGRVLYANEAWAAITGRSRVEAMRMKLADLVHHDDLQKERAAHGEALEGTREVCYPLRLVTDQMGPVRWFRVMKKAVRMPLLEGEAGLLITLEDDTERRAWEESLITAKVSAENLSEAKTLYLSKASHELRTPLHGILSLLELLLGTRLDAEQRRWAETAELSAKTLLGIFEDVLEVSKLERGAVKLNVKPTDLETMVRSVIAMFENAAREKGLELTCQTEAGLPREVEIDELRTRQVLINLISNAVRYTSKGKVQMRVQAVERPGDGRVWLEFAVTDTGPGIPLQDQEKLFIPFVQLENHQRVRGEGSGLGLPIVRELCRLMNADLRVESDGVSGTTMRFYLPTRATVKPAAEAEREPSPAKELQGKKVLVVEDNEISRYVAAQHFSALGAAVTTAVDGIEALEMLKREWQDLVLMDCAMPRMNGFEAARWMRAQPRDRGARCPIIACTADTSLDNHHKCLEAGMDAVLTKPYARQQLLEAVRQVMSLRRQPGHAEVLWERPAALDQGAVLNLELIGISLEADPAFARHYLGRTFSLFRQLVPEELALIRQALREGDADQLSKRLHHLKSSAAAIGAEQLTLCCGWFEELAATAHREAGGLPSEQSVLRPLEELIKQCLARMREVLAETPEPDLDAAGP